jgi:hypothetical protein
MSLSGVICTADVGELRAKGSMLAAKKNLLPIRDPCQRDRRRRRASCPLLSHCRFSGLGIPVVDEPLTYCAAPSPTTENGPQ